MTRRHLWKPTLAVAAVGLLIPGLAWTNDCTHDRAKKMWCAASVPQCPSTVTLLDQCSYYQHGILNKDFFGCSPNQDTKCRGKESEGQPVLALCFQKFYCIGIGTCTVDMMNPVPGGSEYAVVNETLDCDI